MNVTTESIHFTADRKLIDFIEDKLNKLSQYYDRIIDADVKLKLEKTGRVQDKIVEIKLGVPGSTLFAKEVDKTFETSIDQCVQALRRQLLKYKDRMTSH